MIQVNLGLGMLFFGGDGYLFDAQLYMEYKLFLLYLSMDLSLSLLFLRS